MIFLLLLFLFTCSQETHMKTAETVSTSRRAAAVNWMTNHARQSAAPIRPPGAQVGSVRRRQRWTWSPKGCRPEMKAPPTTDLQGDWQPDRLLQRHRLSPHWPAVQVGSVFFFFPCFYDRLLSESAAFLIITQTVEVEDGNEQESEDECGVGGMKWLDWSWTVKTARKAAL